MVLGMVALLGLVGGCTIDLPGEDAPEQALYYPIDLVGSSDGRFLYVLNSNFDRRYNSGWVSVVDLDVVLANTGTTAHDGLKTSAEGGMIRVMPLGGALDMLQLDSGASVAVVSHRGANHRDESILTMVDISSDGDVISCSGAERSTTGMTPDEERTDCDEDHLIRIGGDGADEVTGTADVSRTVLLGELDNPFPVTFFQNDSGASMAAVGFLDSGWVRFYDVSEVEEATSIRFRSMYEMAERGMGAFAVHPAANQSFLTGTSIRGSNSEIYSLDLTRTLSEESVHAWTRDIGALLGGSRLLHVAYSSDGSRAYVVNEAPDSLVVLNAELVTVSERLSDGSYRTDSVRPSYDVLSVMPLHGRPTGVAVIERDGADDLIAVSSFEENLLYLFSAAGDSLRLEHRFELDTGASEAGGIGTGPFQVHHVRRTAETFPEYKDLIVVANFSDHSLSVLDVTPQNPTDFSVIAKVQNAIVLSE